MCQLDFDQVSSQQKKKILTSKHDSSLCKLRNEKLCRNRGEDNFDISIDFEAVMIIFIMHSVHFYFLLYFDLEKYKFLIQIYP